MNCRPRDDGQRPRRKDLWRTRDRDQPASKIEALLLAELQKSPTLHDTQSVTVRPYSGPGGWTWPLDKIEPEVGPEQSKFADVSLLRGECRSAALQGLADGCGLGVMQLALGADRSIWNSQMVQVKSAKG